MRRTLCLLACCGLFCLATPATAPAADVKPLLKALRSVGAQGAGQREASKAWQKLAKCDVSQTPEILAGLDDAGPLAANWIRSAVDAICERQLRSGGKLPQAELEKFVLDTGHAPRARRQAFEWLTRVDSTTPDRLVPKFLHDPSVEFRRDAVTRLLDQAKALDSKDEKAAGEVYREAFSGARDQDQVDAITKRLRELGQQVDLPTHYGFLMTWKIIGPFDNTNKKGYDTVYPPETEAEIDFAASHDGKEGAIKWIDYTTAEDYGVVDLNSDKVLGKHMGATAYAVAIFDSEREQEVDLRLGCINANKLWLNGQQLAAHEVYHTGTKMDQYVARGTLKAGRNVILLKVCQNEQTESWAQNWAFQLRVCDPAGTAILSQDRLAGTEAKKNAG